MDFTIKRSRRRTASLEVREDGSVLVRCPLYYPARECEKFVEAKRDWILRQQAALRHDPRRREFSPEEIGELKRRAREFLVPKTEEYAERFGFTYKRVTVTSARKRFGSCSGDGAISYSCFLMLYPEAAAEYVVMHELCHTVHHDHSPRFYALLARCMPDHAERKKLLR